MIGLKIKRTRIGINMSEFFKSIVAFFTTIFMLFTSPGNEVGTVVNKTFSFTYLEYPAEAVKSLDEWGISEATWKSRANAEGEVYTQAQGYTDINGIVISPYYTVRIEGKQIPVYASTVFVGTTQQGELHSFAEVYVPRGAKFPFKVQLNSEDLYIKNVTVLPESSGTRAICSNYVMNTEINDYGTYTFLFNDESQSHAFTLFVREQIDEEAEIAKLREQYGDSLYVVEKGFYPMDYVSIVNGSIVYYLKQGAYLLANHLYDINSDADDQSTVEDGASSNTGIGLTRYPFLNFNGCNTVKLLGNGVIDLSHLDRHERRGVVFTFTNDIEVRGIKIINPPEWSFITYRCTNVKISDVDIFGYRQNSDAFAICNSQNITVDNCFARSGDDLFDVKTLGGDENAISKNVTFTNCIAWNGKARCFGICGEVNRPISDIKFKDCAVIYHDATWNADRIPALAIIVEQGGGSISNVTFENIEIHHAASRAIGCLILTDGIENFNIDNITYKNISYSSALANKISSNNMTSNKLSANFENLYYNGNKVTTLDSGLFEYDSYSTLTLK